MEPLNLKLVRDLSGMKGQAIAVALVMACGLAVMIMARSLILSLASARDAYYTSCCFADIFCDLKRAPNALRSRLAEITGVAGVETRVTGSLILDLPGVKEPADGEILSVPEDRPQQLNLLFLRAGRLPEPGSNDEVVVGEAFAAAHGLNPPDTIDATIHGARQRLHIVGIGLSPEHVYETRPGETVPDNRRFGAARGFKWAKRCSQPSKPNFRDFSMLERWLRPKRGSTPPKQLKCNVKRSSTGPTPLLI